MNVGSATPPIASTRATSAALMVEGAPLETLPAPTQLDATQDMLSTIFKLISESTKVKNELAQNQVSLNQTSRRIEEKKVREAMERAQRDAQEGTIFSKITKNIGILGVVGLATFNYGLVAADVGVHASGAVKNLKVDVLDAAAVAVAQTRPELLAANILLRKLEITPDEIKATLDEVGLGTDVPGISDEDVEPVVEKAVQLNLLVAGAAVSVLSAGTTTALVVALAAVALSGGAFAAQTVEAPPWLTLGLQISGAVLSIGAGLASNAGTTLGHSQALLAKAKAVGTGINAASTGMAGADTIISAVAQHDIDEANIDATEARNRLARLQRVLEDLIDVVQEAQGSHRRATGAVHKALETHNQTIVATASAIRA